MILIISVCFTAVEMRKFFLKRNHCCEYIKHQVYLYINLACLPVFVCLFVSNEHQNGWTDRAQIFCGTSRDSREGLWIIKISNICLHQNSIVIKFSKILKIREIFCKNPRIIFVLFYDAHKENMFTINLEDGREAPSKARKKGAKRLEFLVLSKKVFNENFILFLTFNTEFLYFDFKEYFSFSSNAFPKSILIN